VQVWKIKGENKMRIAIGSKGDFEEILELFGKKYNLEKFNKLSAVKKRHRMVDIILGESIYDASAIFHFLIEYREK